jgi:hypothetical protein
MKLDWINDLPETKETVRFVYGSDSRSLDNCAKIFSRVYSGQQAEYTACV